MRAVITTYRPEPQRYVWQPHSLATHGIVAAVLAKPAQFLEDSDQRQRHVSLVIKIYRLELYTIRNEAYMTPGPSQAIRESLVATLLWWAGRI
jgi:hypothetical protein